MGHHGDVGITRDERTDGEDRVVLSLRILESAYGSLQRSVGDDVRFRVLEEAAEPYLRGELSA